MALPPAAGPNWIFPIAAPGYLASYNGALQNLLYPPLYQPVRKGETLTMDNPRNLAEPPRYGDGDTTVTVPGGSNTFAGTDLAGAPEPVLRGVRGNTIGMVFQDPLTSLNPTMTIGAQVAEPLLLQ